MLEGLTFDNSNPLDHLLAKEMVEIGLGNLNERERDVIESRFIRLEQLHEIGDRLGVCRERIRQIECRAVRKAKAAIIRKFSRQVTPTQGDLDRHRAWVDGYDEEQDRVKRKTKRERIEQDRLHRDACRRADIEFRRAAYDWQMINEGLRQKRGLDNHPFFKQEPRLLTDAEVDAALRHRMGPPLDPVGPRWEYQDDDGGKHMLTFEELKTILLDMMKDAGMLPG